MNCPLAANADIRIDASAGIDEWMQALYDELRQLAHSARRRGAAGETLDTTALVHEAYLKLCTGTVPRFEQPRQFFAYAAQAMRHILVDRARAQASLRAGGDGVRVTLTASGSALVGADPAQTLALDRALDDLALDDARAAKVVELHYFAGLPLERVAEMLGVVRRTVDRDWRYARAFLMARID